MNTHTITYFAWTFTSFRYAPAVANWNHNRARDDKVYSSA